MLHVPVTVRASSLHGLGVFAAAPIAKGTVVWSFTSGFDLETSLTQLEQLPGLLQERLRHYGYIDRRLNRYVLCCDDARFLNHSSSPNLAHAPTGSSHGSDVAARDIEPGEELTVDYRKFEDGNFEDGAALLFDAGATLNAARTGIILNTQNFAACRAFYRDTLGLKELFAKEEHGFQLSCLEFGGSYLLLETGGHANPAGKSISENPTKLRFNVRSLEDTQSFLRTRGVDAVISRYDWGATINLRDPDGNRIGIRDEAGFIRQIGGAPTDTKSSC